MTPPPPEMQDSIQVRKVSGGLGLVFTHEKANVLGIREDDELLAIPDEGGGIRLIPYESHLPPTNGRRREFMQLPREAFRKLEE